MTLHIAAGQLGNNNIVTQLIEAGSNINMIGNEDRLRCIALFVLAMSRG